MKAQDMVAVHNVIISVYDKAGLEDFAQKLCALSGSIAIYSSGGTAEKLEAVVRERVHEIAQYTRFPEMPGGLVKTLHPKIHAGLLAEEENGEHDAYLEMHGIKKFDLVVVNLYPFSKVTVQPGATVEDARRNMDIGGVSLIEAAAKNFLRVAVIVDPADYNSVLANLKKNGGKTDLITRITLAKKALRYLAAYLAGISEYYQKTSDDKIAAQYGVEHHEWKERLQERLR